MKVVMMEVGGNGRSKSKMVTKVISSAPVFARRPRPLNALHGLPSRRPAPITAPSPPSNIHHPHADTYTLVWL